MTVKIITAEEAAVVKSLDPAIRDHWLYEIGNMQDSMDYLRPRVYKKGWGRSTQDRLLFEYSCIEESLQRLEDDLETFTGVSYGDLEILKGFIEANRSSLVAMDSELGLVEV